MQNQLPRNINNRVWKARRYPQNYTWKSFTIEANYSFTDSSFKSTVR